MKALVLFSGGVDSTTCLAIAVEKYGKNNVTALSISYGQKHTKEIQAAEKIAEYYGVELKKLDLARIFEGSDCSLLSSSGEDIPKESYAEQLEFKQNKINRFLKKFSKPLPIIGMDNPFMCGKRGTFKRLYGNILRHTYR